MSIPIDVFGLSGQSNSTGQGDYSFSPHVIPATVYVFQPSTGLFVTPNDPMAGANTGCAWPSFGAAYYGATGRKVLIVQGAVNASAQSAAADYGSGNWDISGTLTGSLITSVNTAMGIAVASGFTPTLRGIVHGPEGETDGMKIIDSAGGYVSSQYRTALNGMIARYRTAFGSGLPVFQVRIGSATGPWAKYEPGFAQIRSEQETVAASDPLSPIVYRGAVTLGPRGLMPGGLHYHQVGYNEMGAVAAATIAASGLVPAVTAPAAF